MPVDDDLKAEIQKQIDLLELLRTEVEDAIGRAKTKIALVDEGKTREQVFPKKQ
jgi:hypothetical protein